MFFNHADFSYRDFEKRASIRSPLRPRAPASFDGVRGNAFLILSLRFVMQTLVACPLMLSFAKSSWWSRTARLNLKIASRKKQEYFASDTKIWSINSGNDDASRRKIRSREPVRLRNSVKVSRVNGPPSAYIFFFFLSLFLLLLLLPLSFLFIFIKIKKVTLVESRESPI